MNIKQLLELTIARNASDIHLLVGSLPTLRINGELTPIPGTTELTIADIEGLIFPILTPYQKQYFTDNWELDSGLEFENNGRFRINLYRQQGNLAASLRYIPKEIKTLDEIGVSPAVARLTELQQGLVLVTGPTGHGKSTTLASFINQINNNRPAHIITIEDPIEFIYPKSKALISQRELNSDTKTWSNALKAALREDPDVVLVGEMRDLDTVSATMTIAETGHLVFATLHTNSAAQTIDRIIDVFPENQQPQIRTQLASVLEAVLSLRLVPTITPGRVLAMETLFGVPATRSLIRDNKTHLINNLIQTSGEIGMVSMETALATLVRRGKITAAVAENYALNPQVLNKLLSMGTTNS